MNVTIRCTDGTIRSPVDTFSHTTIEEIARDASRDGSALVLPFKSIHISNVLKYRRACFDVQDMTLEDVVCVLRCREFMGIDGDPDSDALLNKMYAVTMCIVKSSGVNLFHFDQSSLFTSILSKVDDRFVHIPRVLLEKLYWTCMQAHLDLDASVKSWIGIEAFDELIGIARRERITYDII